MHVCWRWFLYIPVLSACGTCVSFCMLSLADSISHQDCGLLFQKNSTCGSITSLIYFKSLWNFCRIFSRHQFPLPWFSTICKPEAYVSFLSFMKKLDADLSPFGLGEEGGGDRGCCTNRDTNLQPLDPKLTAFTVIASPLPCLLMKWKEGEREREGKVYATHCFLYYDFVMWLNIVACGM